MARFRDRRICLELCPTSNVEVVGYRDPLLPETAGLARYPLRTFIEQGVPVTLCTDNPGISRTTLAAEYLAASRMTEGGLSLWEAMALMRQAFVSSFLPGADRDAMLREADLAVRGVVLVAFGTTGDAAWTVHREFKHPLSRL